MRFFLHYLRSRRLILCSFAAALFAFPLIFFLYGLPKQALLYPSALAALIGLCAFTADFLKFRRRHALQAPCRHASSLPHGKSGFQRPPAIPPV